MKAWKFKVNNSPKELSEKLASSLGAGNRFVLDLDHDKKNLVQFKLRKRMLLAFEIMARNNIIVKGNILKSGPHNEADVEITFTHHTLSKLLIFVHLILGLGFLAALIMETNSSPYMLLAGGILIGAGFFLWLHLQKIFEKNVQEYKALLSNVLEL